MKKPYNEIKLQIFPEIEHIIDIKRKIITLEKIAKIAKEQLQHAVITLGIQADGSDYLPDVIRELYWEYLDINVTWISESFGISLTELRKIAGKFSDKYKCRLCGKPLIAKSREALRTIMIAYSRRNKERGIDYTRACLTCPECQEQEEKEYEKEGARDEERRENRKDELKVMPYVQYLRSPEWKQIRNSQLANAGHRCQVCNRNGISLHVHHRTYERRGRENFKDLIVLCAECHALYHGKLVDK